MKSCCDCGGCWCGEWRALAMGLSVMAVCEVEWSLVWGPEGAGLGGEKARSGQPEWAKLEPIRCVRDTAQVLEKGWFVACGPTGLRGIVALWVRDWRTNASDFGRLGWESVERLRKRQIRGANIREFGYGRVTRGRRASGSERRDKPSHKKIRSGSARCRTG